MSELSWYVFIEVIAFIGLIIGHVAIAFVVTIVISYKCVEYCIFWPIEKTIKRFG